MEDKRKRSRFHPSLLLPVGILLILAASYLEVAVRLGIPLATLDRTLARAAADEGVRAVG